MSGVPPIPQQPQVPHYQHYGQPPTEPKTSALAIAAFVCGLLFCIPMATPAAAIVLGIIALIVIGTSNGKVKGNGFAITGIIFGLLSGVLQVWAFSNAMGFFQGQFGDPAKQLIASLEAGDIDTARQSLSPSTSSALSDDELSSFGKALQSNCGKIVDVKLDMKSSYYIQTGKSNIQINTNFNPNQSAPMPMPMAFKFDSGTYFGYVELVGNPNPMPGASIFKVGDIGILINGNTLTLIPDPDASTTPDDSSNSMNDDSEEDSSDDSIGGDSDI